MNKITTWFTSRLVMMVLMLSSMAYAVAQNVITIDPVTITSSAGVTVPVNLSSTTDIRTLIFDITLPNGVTFGKTNVALVADRLDLQEGEKPSDLYNIDVQQNPDNKGNNVWRIGLFGSESYSKILAGEGEFLTLKLSITEAAYLAGGTFIETISTEKTNGVDGSEFVVTIVAPEAPVANVTVPAEIEVEAGVKAPLTISLENNLKVSALMLDIELPEALSFAMNGRRYDYTTTSRLTEGSTVKVTEKENGIRVIISNVGSNVIAGPGAGALLSFNVIADDVHFKSQVKVYGIDATMKWGGENKDVYSPAQTVEVINTTVLEAVQAQVEEDMEQVNEITNAFVEFQAETEEVFPAFLTLHADAIAEVYAKIEALNNLLVEAQVEADETGVYTGLSAEATSEVVDMLMGLVTDEAEALAAIENGAMEDMEALAELAYKIDDYIENPDNYSETVVDMAYNVMAELYNYSNAIWEAEMTAKQETGVYESPISQDILDYLANEVEEIIKTSSIGSIVNVNDGAVYYDINGQKVNDPKAGRVYIQVVNGKATKVIR